MSYDIITAKTRQIINSHNNLSIWKKIEFNCQRKNNCPESSKCQTTKTLQNVLIALVPTKGIKTDLQSRTK